MPESLQTKRCLCGLLLLMLVYGGYQTALAQRPNEMVALEPDKPIEREMQGGESHFFTMALNSGQFLHIVVEQKGIDVVVLVFDPEGKKLAEVDSPNGTSGPEPVSFLTEIAGNYRLEIRSLEKDAPAGKYEAKIVVLRAAIPQDKARIAAEKAFGEGELLYAQGTKASLKQAIEKYEEALPLLRAIGNQKGEGNTFTRIGNVYSTLKEPQKALDYYNQALPILRSVKDRYGEAATLSNTGIVYNDLGEINKALDNYAQALPLFHELGERRGEANTLNNIGALYYDLGEIKKALEHYDQALVLYRAIGDRSDEASILNNFGNLYRGLNEGQKALDYLGQSLALFRALGDHRGEAYALFNMGNLYNGFGENEKAIDYLMQGLAIYRSTGNRIGEADTLNNIGRVYDESGERQKGLDFLGQGLQLYRMIGNRSGEAFALNNIGNVYYRSGDKEKALGYYNQVLPIFRALESRNGQASTLNNIGAVYNELGETQKALDCLEQGLRLYQTIENREGEAESLYDIASIERNRGNLLEALNSIKKAIELVELIRANVASQQLRSSYFATVQAYYQLYINLLMKLHDVNAGSGYDGEALQVSERVRARSLLELLVESHADIRQGVDAQLVERERDLQQRLNAKADLLIKLLSDNFQAEQKTAIEMEINSINTELDQVRAEIRQKSPHYAALTQPRPLSLKEIQQLLDADTILLEYSLGKEQSYLWAVTTSSIKSFSLAKQEEIEAEAKLYYQLLSTKLAAGQDIGAGKSQQQSIAQADEECKKSADKLSRLILSPIADLIGKHRLVIVADGALQYVPFAALKDPAAREYQPLIIKHEIINLPSASTLSILRHESGDRKPAAKTVAILADPVFDNGDERAQSTTNRTAQPTADQDIGGTRIFKYLANNDKEPAHLHIPRLQFTRNEAESIAAIAGPSVYKALDFAASKSTVNIAELSQYRFIHFATHGYLDTERPEFSALLLSMVDEKGNPQDGFLRTNEIFNLNLPAELVVLSACKTGLGKEIKGEGLVGLTRGFMYAGAARVVVSLWSVNDQATAELMTKFYTHMLKENMRPAAALRATQIEMLYSKKYRAPFYWAPFILQGELN
jgi:CHAT domain-containing protein